jgi:subtilisin family serine protease
MQNTLQLLNITADLTILISGGSLVLRLSKMKSFLKPFVTILSITLLNLFAFNNCGKISSQTSHYISSSNAGGSSSLGNNNNPNMPVNANNSYVLQCITSSDGLKVSSALTDLIDQNLAAGNSRLNKLNSLDWDQKTDLIVYLDNQCIQDTNYSDPILSYVDLNQVDLDLNKTVYQIKKDSVTNLKLFIENALASECLIHADKNYELKINQVTSVQDTHQQYQYYLQSGSPGEVKIGATEAMMDQVFSYVENPTYAANNKKVKVAVIDTGADSNNPDLKNLIKASFNTTTDPSLGATKDSGYHGTHVAGLVAAEYKNGFGIRGAYGRHVELYIYRATNNGETFSIAALINAVNSAVLQNVDIINMSLSTSQDIPSLREAITNASAAGKIIVVAAGNGDSNGVGQLLGTSFPVYPAMYSSSIPGVVTVGSVDSGNNQKSSFSNYSPTFVNILAPGSHRSADNTYSMGILSTLPADSFLRDNLAQFNPTREGAIRTGTTSLMYTANIGAYVRYLVDTNDDGPTRAEDIPDTPNSAGTGGAPAYSAIHGTSMSAPIVSGSIAMMISMARSRGITFTSDDIKTMLAAGSLSSSNFSNFSAGNGKYLNTPALFNHVSQQIQNRLGTTPGPTPNPQPPLPPTGLTISVQPSAKKVVLGERIELTVTASGTGTLSYQWYKNGFAISGANSRNLIFNNTAETDGASYRVQVSSTSESISSSSVDLKVAMRYCN